MLNASTVIAAIFACHHALHVLSFSPSSACRSPVSTSFKWKERTHGSSTSRNLGDFFNNFAKSENKSKESTPSIAAEETSTKSEDDDYYDEDDPIEKIFGVFFGKKEKNPMGMARFGQARFPEQYPATVDEWAEPVQGDTVEMALLRPFLKNTNLETRGLRLTYDANRDGWDAAKFHAKVDKQGGGIVFGTTRSGLQFGGYNPKGWVGYGEARGSIAAFLFVLGGQFTTASAPGVKLRKVGGPGLAQMDLPESGPSFSPDALVIPMEKNNPRVARSKLGSYYERFPDGTNSLFGKDASVQLKELKVYHGVYAEGEYIPFTDAEPFALY
ncbi:hypothetical protein HJC23_010504 [Cyclotella cryptica]|uniref:TLDc domain-containing protein n=1 Tax=Cyclotella cryptica TaxID=29204 RepID=A0ABD3QAG5_9STRA